jgi:RNA-directed DNA polymerase
LERAWELVRANHGAAGIDKQTIADVEEYGVAKLLDQLAVDLREGRWRPLPARRVFIAKPGRDELRPLSITRTGRSPTKHWTGSSTAGTCELPRCDATRWR